MAKLQWQNVAPADTSNYLDAIARANQQTQAGLGGIQEAFKGYYGDLKDRNTNEMLTILNGAQNQEQLGLAQQQIAALQQKYGSGYDMNKVRDAIDMRPDTLLQRQTNQMNFDEKQANFNAIAAKNQAAYAFAKSRGATDEQLAGLAQEMQANPHADLTGIVNQFGEYAWDKTKFDTTNNQWNQNFNENQRQFNLRQNLDERQFNLQTTQAQINAAKDYAAGETPVTQSIDANGNVVTTGGGNKIAQYAAQLSPIFQGQLKAESNFTHRKADGSLTRSPAGALGIAQIMPKTAAQPGYGMKPINLETTSAEEQIAWANEYRNRIQKYHSFTDDQATAAYNAGAGKVQKAIAKGGKDWLSRMPDETKGYVSKVNRYAASVGGGGSAATGITLPMASYQKTLASYEDNKLKWNMERQKKDQPLDPARFNQIDPKAERNWFTADSRDVIDQIKKNPLSNNLDLVSLQKVYGAANDWMQSAKGYENINGSGNGNLAKQISILLKNESDQVAKQRKHDDSANHPLNAAVQQLQQEFRAAGGEISRANAIKLLDREHYDNYYAPKESKAAKQVQKVAAKTTTSKPVVNAEPKKVAETVKQVAKPTKQEVVDYFVKKGGKSDVIPNGLNPKQDRQLIQEARLQAAKVIANQKKQQESAKEAQEKLRAQKAKAEKAKLDKQFNDMQLRKFAAQRKKEEEEKQKKAQSKFYGLKS